MPDLVCFTLNELLSPQQCQMFIDQAESNGYRAMGADYPASYRDNDRIVLDDPELAAHLFTILKDRLPAERVVGGQTWTLAGLNSRFRGCRYRAGQSFCRHRDGAHSQEGQCSFLTVMLYLNSNAEFEGGQTRFYEDRWTEEPSFSVPPAAGTGIIFDHALWHDGQAVTDGTKYVLRTDVMYRCPSSHHQHGHSGYVWDIEELPDGRLCSGSRDKTIRVWSRSGRVEQVLRHHSSSVTRLLSVTQTLWSGSRDRRLAIWQPSDSGFAVAKSFQAHEGAILNLVKLHDGRVASSGADNTVRLWNREGGLEHEFETGVWPWALHQLEQGGLLVGADDGTIHRLDLISGKSLLHRQVSSGVTCLLERGNGTLLAGGRDGQIRRWQKFGRRLPNLSGHRGQVTCLAETACSRLVSGSEDDGVRLWEQGESVEILRHNDFVRALCVTSGGELATGSYDGSVRRRPVLPAKSPAAMARTDLAANPGGAISGAAAANW